MSEETDLDAAIQETALSPKAIEVDGQKSQSQSIPDLIALKKMKAADAATARPLGGIGLVSFNRPGAV